MSALDGLPSRLAGTVLVVEDNPVNRIIAEEMLESLGLDIIEAQDGVEALDVLSRRSVDLVLMDCQMPIMDGYTATRRWREGELGRTGGHHLPIIAMTANAMAGDRQKCIDAGMDDYLAKPVTRAELERCLHRWWRPRVPGGPLPMFAPQPEPAAPVPAPPRAEPVPLPVP